FDAYLAIILQQFILFANSQFIHVHGINAAIKASLPRMPKSLMDDLTTLFSLISNSSSSPAEQLDHRLLIWLPNELSARSHLLWFHIQGVRMRDSIQVG